MNKAKKIGGIVLNVLLWCFVAFALLTTILAISANSGADGVPSVGGKVFLSVESDSMVPTFKKGDLLFAKKLNDDAKKELQVGDVVTYKIDLNGDGVYELNTHRIVEVLRDSDGQVSRYVTKGDNNAQNDAPVACERVLCRWGNKGSEGGKDGAKIGGLGGFFATLQKPVGFLLIIVLPLLLFFVWELVRFIRTLLAVKNRGKRQITAEEEALIRERAVAEYLAQQKANAAGAEAAETDTAAGDAEAGEGTDDAPKA